MAGYKYNSATGCYSIESTFQPPCTPSPGGGFSRGGPHHILPHPIGGPICGGGYGEGPAMIFGPPGLGSGYNPGELWRPVIPHPFPPQLGYGLNLGPPPLQGWNPQSCGNGYGFRHHNVPAGAPEEPAAPAPPAPEGDNNNPPAPVPPVEPANLDMAAQIAQMERNLQVLADRLEQGLLRQEEEHRRRDRDQRGGNGNGNGNANGNEGGGASDRNDGPARDAGRAAEEREQRLRQDRNRAPPSPRRNVHFPPDV